MEEQKITEINQKNQFKLIKIPQITQDVCESTLIGIIDSSGSMGQVWSKVVVLWNEILKTAKNSFTITFSNNSKLVEGELKNNINKYEGGGTNITAGFTQFNELVKLNPKVTKNITAVFMSDGQDNNNKTLQKRLEDIYFGINKYKRITFLTVGIGKYFPTFIAMQLRKMFHSGSPDIPAVFMVNEINEFDDMFTQLNEYLKHDSEHKIYPEIRLYPFSKQKTEIVYENQWVGLYEDEFPKDGLFIFDEDKKKNIEYKEGMVFAQLVEIARAWLQVIQLNSIQGEVKEDAQIAYNALQVLKQKTQLEQNELKSTVGQKNKLTFKQRLQLKDVNSMIIDLNLLIKEIKAFCEDTLLSKLSEQEASKRLAIGTKVGKYHSKAMKIRGLSVEAYQRIRDAFVKKLEECKINAQSDQEPSVVILQNQKDVFMETDLVEGLKICPSQYDLIEALPLIGVGLFIKRSDGAGINPWLITVENIAKHHHILDTVTIYSNENQVSLSTGEGEKEVINCVLPLFGEKDQDIQPFIRSQMYHILMTFNLSLNADTLFDNAYFSLLANTFYYLIFLENNEWRNKIIDKIFYTFNLEYSDTQNIKQYIKTIQEAPQLAVVTDHPDCPTKCEDLVKPIFILFYLLHDKILTLEQNEELIQTIFSRIFIEYFGRFLGNLPEGTKLKHFYSLENEDNILEAALGKNLKADIQKLILPKLNQFYTLNDLKNAISEEVTKLQQQSIQSQQQSQQEEEQLSKNFQIGNIQIQLKEEKLFMNYHKVKLQQLVILYELIMKKPLDKNNYLIWLNHAIDYRNSYERNIEKIETNQEQILKQLKTSMLTDIFSNNKDLTHIYNELSDQFNSMITKTHLFIHPLSGEQIKQKLLKAGLPEFNLIFTENSFLLRNACMAQNCPFFLKENKSLSLHLESNLLKMPAFHKAMKLYVNATPEQIINKCVKGECLEAHLKLPIITEEVKKFYQDPANQKEIYNFIEKCKQFYNEHHQNILKTHLPSGEYQKNYDYYFTQKF